MRFYLSTIFEADNPKPAMQLQSRSLPGSPKSLWGNRRTQRHMPHILGTVTVDRNRRRHLDNL